MGLDASLCALHLTNTFTRDLMGDVAGSYGTQYFDDLQNGRSSFADAAKFIGADLDVQAMGEIGGVALGYALKTTSNITEIGITQAQITFGKSKILKNLGVFGENRVLSPIERVDKMLKINTGYNISPEDWFDYYPKLGRDGTYITDYRAIARIIGPQRPNTQFKLGFFSGNDRVSFFRASRLEKTLGLESGSLTSNGFRFTRISNILERSPRAPIYSDNSLFLGGGKGLPNGDPELVIDSISTKEWVSRGGL